MIADTALFLTFLGIISSIKVGVKADKFLSLFVFFGLFVFFLFFSRQMPFVADSDFSFVWSSLPSGDIHFNIITNKQNAALLFPFLLLTVAELGKNVIFRYEERRSIYDGLLLFNLLALLVVMCSNNFVQLLSGLFAVDILAFFIIKDIDNSKNYVVMNLLADMLLFTVLAVINSRVDSLDIREINRYQQLGQHLNFTVLGAFTAILVKFGFVPFHVCMVQLQHIRFHRLQGILFLTSPAAAIILLLKFSMLWKFSPYFSLVAAAFCLLSAVWGFLGLLLADNLKAKAAYMLLLFQSLFAKTLCDDGFVWSQKQTLMLVCMYLTVNFLYFFYYFANRRKNVSQMAVTSNLSRLSASCLLIGLTFVFAVCFINLFSDISWKNVYALISEKKLPPYDECFVLCFGAALFYGMVALLHQLLNFLKGERQNGKSTLLPKPFFWLLQTVVLFGIMRNASLPVAETAFCGVLFLFVCALPVPSFVAWFYKQKKLQSLEFSNNFYQFFFIAPLRFCGRILWLIIDWLFVEKLLVGTVQTVLKAAVRFFRNIHYNVAAGGLFLFLLLVLLLVLTYYQGREF